MIFFFDHFSSFLFCRPTFSVEKVCIIDPVTLTVSPRTSGAAGVFRTELWPRGPIMMMVCARGGTTGSQAMGGSARARAKHELHHVIVARAPHEPHLDRFAAQLPDWLRHQFIRRSIDCEGWRKSGPFIFCVASPGALGPGVSGMVRLGPGRALRGLRSSGRALAKGSCMQVEPGH